MKQQALWITTLNAGYAKIYVKLSLAACFLRCHRLSTVRNADLIIMMHQGAIVETGTHEELIALQGRYYALYRQQEAG